jgi:serine/threonine protein kinase
MGMLPPDESGRVSVETLAEVVRYAPLRLLSTGLDGMAIAARVSASGAVVELRHATLAQENPERWAVIDGLAKTYALIEHRAFRRLLAREAIAGTPVLVLDGLPERDLGARIAIGPLPPADACALIMTLADALWHAHALGIVHGNLGPSAVLLEDDGAPRLDFPWLDVGRAQTPLDLACHPPERAREALDMRSDVYALGALLQIAILGRAAAPHEPRETLGAFAGLLAQMLTIEREARPNMLEVSRALKGIAGLLEQHESDALTMSQTQPISGGGELAEEIGRPPARALGPGAMLGRIELGVRLGRGGMGEVFRAVDRVSGEAVALKVLRADASRDTDQLKRFRKEARILSELKSPYIARLIELNHDAGTDFLALELVEGQDLAEVQKSRGGRLSEREALEVTADVCRGLSEAHASGIVHRDIKPENVMIARPQGGNAGTGRVKLCDFGIARALDRRSGTLAFTQEDSLLGTPEFMAPEQCNGETLSAATDVYALGVMLFNLLAGRTPFESKDVMSLLLAHTNKPPPKLSEVTPEVSDATAQLVARMLEKRPRDRYADAAAVLEAIEQILRGEPTQIAIHPVRPKAEPARVAQHVFEWELKSSPEALWPFVSNTDRLNRAVGLPPALFERFASDEGVRTQAKNRIAGVDLRWQEHPFEWVEGRRWGVLRVFDRGVLHWFTVELELFAKPGGGTRLRYAMTVEPKHWLGRLIVALEMKHKQRPALSKAFARIDAYASASAPAAPGLDAFEPAPPLTEAQRAALTAQLATLREQGIADDVLDALGAFCVNAPPQEVARLRPLAFARHARLPQDRVVEACLRGAKEGLFSLLWEILCPLCRVPSGFADTLQALKDHGHCPSCNADFQLDFTQSLELVFRVADRIRASDVRTFCIGGPAFAPHVVAQVRLAPGERIALELALGPGAYLVRSPQLPHAVPVEITASAYAQRASVQLSKEPPGEGARVLLASKAQSLSLENRLDREIVARVERTAPRQDALTAARAACMASFRRLFPSEVLAQGRLVAVGRTAFVVTRAVDQRRLMSEIGDARAFEHMLALFDVLDGAASDEGGAVVKTASGVSLSAFASGGQALRAALALRARLDARALEPHVGKRALDVRIAVHEGPAVAATFDGRLDYFGQSVERAIELLDHVPPSHVLVSSAVLQDHSVHFDAGALSHDTRMIDTGDGFALLVQVRSP